LNCPDGRSIGGEMIRPIFNKLREGDIILHSSDDDRYFTIQEKESPYGDIRYVVKASDAAHSKYLAESPSQWKIYWGRDMKTKIQTAVRLISRFTLGLIGAIAIILCLVIWGTYILRG
jgi:hypothetical protein